jgi:hypothetical protein
VIYSGASFLPELHGSLESRPAGTAIRVEMVPSRATLTILAALFAFLAASLFDQDARRVLLTTGGYVLLGWVITLLGFWLDGGRARKKLCAVLSPSARPIDVAAGSMDSDADAN